MVKGEMKSLRITLEAAGPCVLGYVYLREVGAGEAARTEPIVPDSVFADYDVAGRLLGLEFLHADQANSTLMRTLSKQLGVAELAGLDLAEMCKAAV